MKLHNWTEIQKFYDEGKTWRDINKRFSLSNAAISKAIASGYFKSRTPSETLKLTGNHKNRVISDSTRLKISQSRKKFLLDNPDKVPYLLNHCSKGMSYPEQYFKNLFESEQIELTYHYRVGTYQLDFADPIRKIVIEVDGDQHYLDEKIITHDINRDKKLKDNGWLIIRVKWSMFQKLNKEMRHKYILEIKDVINGKNVTELDIEKYQKLIEPNTCPDCGKIIEKTSRHCKTCCVKYKISCWKVKNRPSSDELEEMIKCDTWAAIGLKYNVSPNTIKKWAKNYKILIK
jgi:very-short-patch-repair endonuclease